MTTDLTSLFPFWSFLFSSIFELLLTFEMSFSLSTLVCSPFTVFWPLFFCNFSFSIVSGVGGRFVSDDHDDDDSDEDGNDDDDDDDGNDDNNDNDDDDKDDDNVDGDEDGDIDDDEWLLFCNCSMSSQEFSCELLK